MMFKGAGGLPGAPAGSLSKMPSSACTCAALSLGRRRELSPPSVLSSSCLHAMLQAPAGDMPEEGDGRLAAPYTSSTVPGASAGLAAARGQAAGGDHTVLHMYRFTRSCRAGGLDSKLLVQRANFKRQL